MTFVTAHIATPAEKQLRISARIRKPKMTKDALATTHLCQQTGNITQKVIG